jgi:ABC-2 type transport system permease protein
MRAFRAELLKALSTRLLLWYALGLLAFIVLVLSIHIGSGDRTDLSRVSTQHSTFAVAGLAAVLAVLVGTVLVTAEYAHGTVNQTFLAVPRRERVIAAKLGAALVVAAGLAVLADVATLLVSELWYHGRAIRLHVGSDTTGPFLGTIGACMLAAAIGVGVGALLRRQTAAIVAILLWLLIGEAVIGAVGDKSRYAPGHALGAVVAAHAHGSSDVLARWPAMATGLVYAAVLLAIGLLATLGSDVPGSGD